MSEDSTLLTLQHADDARRKAQARVAEIDAALAADEALEAAKAELAEAETELAALERQQRRLEAEARDLGEKLAREDARLYGGTIMGRELAGLQREVDSLRQRHNAVEDEALGVMANAEDAAATRDAAAARVAAEEQRHAAASATLTHERDRLKAELAANAEERESLRAAVGRGTLAIYDSLLARKAGVAVARLRGSTCSACRVSVPETVRHSVLITTSVTRCPNCERILVLGG